MGCARISLCWLIKSMLPGRTARITAFIFATFTALWTISGVLVASFSCSLPNPWQWSDSKTCIDARSWVNYVGSTNIIVEVLLISIPLCIWNIRTSAGRRMSGYTYDLWRTVLCVQIAQNLSVITACLPTLHPFIVKMLAGSIKDENVN
ncbi:hypothetical protein BU23DRAFT_429164, partial [Bimuria novae-zelandiae CBS 107.79]